MKFIVHTDSSGKKTLYPNKSNTPNDILKQGVEEFEVSTDKQELMELLQELLDRIPAEPDTSDIPEAGPEFFENAKLRIPGPDTADLLTFPKEGPLSTKEELNLRTLVHDQWENLPFAWKTDLMCGLMDQVRNLRPRTKEED